MDLNHKSFFDSVLDRAALFQDQILRFGFLCSGMIFAVSWARDGMLGGFGLIAGTVLIFISLGLYVFIGDRPSNQQEKSFDENMGEVIQADREQH